MKVQPLDDKIVVKRIETEEASAGGIILPDTAKEKPQQGKVVSVGAGKLLESGARSPLHVKEGDRILFGSYAGSTITVGDEEFVILQEDDILAALEQSAAPTTERVPEQAIEETPVETSIPEAVFAVAPSMNLVGQFLHGMGSVLEFFPAPDFFDPWRLQHDVALDAWPLMLREELARFQE
jgi:chaperonin GroES